MKNKKRHTFKCWNCARTYTLLREITAGQEWIVACPYCLKEAVVNLGAYKKPTTVGIFKDQNPAAGPLLEDYHLPEIIPTAAREE